MKVGILNVWKTRRHDGGCQRKGVAPHLGSNSGTVNRVALDTGTTNTGPGTRGAQTFGSVNMAPENTKARHLFFWCWSGLHFCHVGQTNIDHTMKW